MINLNSIKKSLRKCNIKVYFVTNKIIIYLNNKHEDLLIFTISDNIIYLDNRINFDNSDKFIDFIIRLNDVFLLLENELKEVSFNIKERIILINYRNYKFKLEIDINCFYIDKTRFIDIKGLFDYFSMIDLLFNDKVKVNKRIAINN